MCSRNRSELIMAKEIKDCMHSSHTRMWCAHRKPNQILKLHVMRVSVFPSIHWRQDDSGARCRRRCPRQMIAHCEQDNWVSTVEQSFGREHVQFICFLFVRLFSLAPVVGSFPSHRTNFRTSRTSSTLSFPVDKLWLWRPQEQQTDHWKRNEIYKK